MSFRDDLGQLLKSNYVPGSTPFKPIILWEDEERELDGFRPLIKVYLTHTPPGIPKGLGYTHRAVDTHLSIDLKCRSNTACEYARKEILRILGKYCVCPFPGVSQIEYNEGDQKAAYSGFYWWIIEAKLHEPRKPTGRE